MTAGADQLALLIQTLGRTYGRAPSVADFLSVASELNLLNEQMLAVHADAKSMLAASRHNVSLKTWVEWLTVAKSADDDLKCVWSGVIMKSGKSCEFFVDEQSRIPFCSDLLVSVKQPL